MCVHMCDSGDWTECGFQCQSVRSPHRLLTNQGAEADDRKQSREGVDSPFFIQSGMNE